MDCRAALNVYECFAMFPVSDLESESIPKNLVATTAEESVWKLRQKHQVQNRFMMAAAALLFIGFALVSQPAPSPGVAFNDAVVDSTQTTMTTAAVEENSVANDFSNLLYDTWTTSKSWTGSLADSSYNNLTSIGDIDLTALLPRESTRVVQSIPATIETIEPIYRYSIDFPMMNRWSSGINYTIGLIQGSFNQPPADTSPVPGDDLGDRASSGNTNIC